MRMLVDTNVSVLMRDGVRLAADVYQPSSRGPFPTLITRSPYDKSATSLINLRFDIQRGVAAGYAVVAQDTRGRFASGGEFTPFAQEGEDGADTIAWAAAQPWCNGMIGMMGGSYLGVTQWAAAAHAGPALGAIAPFASAANYYDHWAYQGGAFQLGFNLFWTLSSLALGELVRQRRSGSSGPDDLTELVEAIDGVGGLYRRLPLLSVPELKSLAPYYGEWLRHPSLDDYWRGMSPAEVNRRITVPALNIGGWFDIFLRGTLANYTRMKQAVPGSAAPRLIVGPWAHMATGGLFPESSYGFLGNADAFDLFTAQLRWFDRWLNSRTATADDDSPVQIFVMGSNVWRGEADWPLPDTTYSRFYLHSDGRAGAHPSSGGLSSEPPSEEPEDTFLYDPRDPVPTCGGATYLPGLAIGANAGPRDQRAIESRRDVLSYTSPPLASAVEVTGPIRLVLFASSTAPDTDFTGKLIDVAPDGRAMSLTDGIVRARYRESLSEPSLLEAGRVYEIVIDLAATSNVFGAGHRIRVDVSSSNFPRFDRNTNTGGVIAEDGFESLSPAVNRIYHCAGSPSYIELPIIDR